MMAMKVMRASSVGFPCDRALWYMVNGVASEITNPRILEVGSTLEALVVKWLREDGWEVRYNPGSQDADLELKLPVHGGVISGHPDCWISQLGMENILVDIKTMNDRSFSRWKKDGTEKDKPQYVDQVHVYATAAMNINIPVERLGIVGLNKNNSDIHIDFFDFVPERMAAIIQRTERIFASDEEPEPGNRMQAWCCGYCGFGHLCELAQEKKKSTAVGDGMVMTDNPVIISAMELLQEGRNTSKAGKDMEDEAKSVLDKEVLQQGIKSVWGGNLILTLIEKTSSKFDTKAFKNAHPDLAGAFSKFSSSVTYDLKEAV